MREAARSAARTAPTDHAVSAVGPIFCEHRRVTREPILLHTTPPTWGLPSASPACAKLQTWLRMVGLDYEVPPLDLSQAPKGKLPFVEIGEQTIGDSTLIIAHLGQRHGVDLDAVLGPRERGVSLAFRRMLKENDYWAVIHSRYLIPDNWAVYRPMLGVLLVPEGPEPDQLAAAEGLKQTVVDAMHGHGIGRHSDAERVALLCEDLSAVADLLGAREWMMGKDGPTTLDATVFGYVGNLIWHPFDDALSTHARAQTKLVALCERIRARYFPELAPA